MIDDRKHITISVLSIVFLSIGMYMGIICAHIPPHFQSPLSQKIFYIHVPSAWVSYVAYALIFISGILHFTQKKRNVEKYILCSARVGFIFCAIAIITGSIWAKAEWGVFWLFEDAKLTTTLILLLAYIGMLVFPKDSLNNLCTYAIASFIAVPLSFISSRLWFSVHPNIIASKGTSISHDILISLFVSLIGMTLLFISLLLYTLKIENIEEKIEKMVIA